MALIVCFVIAVSLAAEGESQATCAPPGNQELSASLIQSASLKRKVLFDGREEEREGRPPGPARSAKEAAPPAQDGARGLAAPGPPAPPPGGERRAGLPRLLLLAARSGGNSTRALADLWGGAGRGLAGAAALLRGAAGGAAGLEAAPAAVLLLAVALCLAGAGFGLCGALPLPAGKDRPAAPGPEPPWKHSAPRTPLPEEAAAKRGARAEAAPRRFSLPPDPTPVQSALSVCRGTPASSLVADPQQAGSFLCPGLVVPEECECSLLVPRLEPQAANCEVTVDDAACVPVFRVAYCLPSRSDGPATQPGKQGSPQRVDQDGNRCLVLSSSADDRTVFAFCRLGLNGALTILDASEKPFGLIRMRVGKSGFEVATRLGSQIHLSLTDTNDLEATDRRGRTLALTESIPGDALRRMVRIGPFVDAGLITLAILAVDLLESMPS